MPTKKATRPIQVEIVNIDEIRTAVYEGILMANNADAIDKWHILSKMKYRGKGWSAIARMMLALEAEQQGGNKGPSKDDISRKAREVQRNIEAHRKYILGTDTEDQDW